jgi:hypothetical protein
MHTRVLILNSEHKKTDKTKGCITLIIYNLFAVSWKANITAHEVKGRSSMATRLRIKVIRIKQTTFSEAFTVYSK